MGKCGEGHKFQNTVGTFRFLNELVKLVSPKYLAAQTDAQVKNKILDLLLLWTVQFPVETKVKEAYEMLRRQGVLHQSPNPITIQKKPPAPVPVPVVGSSTTNQDPTSLKIKQLIQAKNPGRVDIHAANLLIQNFYEIEKKKTLRVQEIRKGRENVSVLNEMMDHFSVSESSADDIALIRELYESCRSLQPTIRLLTEDTTQQDEQVLQDALETNDLLVQVVQKYEAVIVQGGQPEKDARRRTAGEEQQLVMDDALIDMQMGAEGGGGLGQAVIAATDAKESDHLAELEDIFGSLNLKTNIDQPNMILSPENVTKRVMANGIMGTGPGVAVPVVACSEPAPAVVTKSMAASDMDSMISEILKAQVTVGSKNKITPPPTWVHDFEGIRVDLDSIEPSDVPPRIILNEPKGLKVVLNFTKEHPKEHVSVIVVSVANQSPNLVTDIDLALVPGHGECAAKVVDVDKESGVRSLAGVKRFSSAVDDLAIIVLVSNPNRVQVPLWSITLKYCMEGEQKQQQPKELQLSVSDLPDLF